MQEQLPKGGVISPLLANLFMHYAFNYWLEKHIPDIWFERYADDALIHCRTRKESVLERVRKRLEDCGLTFRGGSIIVGNSTHLN